MKEITRACPFCGEMDELYPETFLVDEYEYNTVRCHNCGAQGPENFNKEQAIEAWDEREEE